jgi:lambda family phage tail tape measure protein
MAERIAEIIKAETMADITAVQERIAAFQKDLAKDPSNKNVSTAVTALEVELGKLEARYERVANATNLANEALIEQIDPLTELWEENTRLGKALAGKTQEYEKELKIQQTIDALREKMGKRYHEGIAQQVRDVVEMIYHKKEELALMKDKDEATKKTTENIKDQVRIVQARLDVMREERKLALDNWKESNKFRQESLDAERDALDDMQQTVYEYYTTETEREYNEFLKRASHFEAYIEGNKELTKEYYQWRTDMQERFERPWLAGLKEGLKDAADNIGWTFDNVSSTVKSAFSNMTDVLTDFVMTGKASFKDFADSIIRNIVRIQIQQSIIKPMAGSLGVMTGFATGSGATTASAGMGFPNVGYLDKIGGGVSSLLGYTLPGTTISYGGPAASLAAAEAGRVGATGLSLGSTFGYGALGSLGYSTIGGMIGLPQSQYSGITSGLGGMAGAWGGSALAAGMASGAAMGSWLPGIGTAIGAVAGGLLGSAIGGSDPGNPSLIMSQTTHKWGEDLQIILDKKVGGIGDKATQAITDNLTGFVAAQEAGIEALAAFDLSGEAGKALEEAAFNWGRKAGGLWSSWDFNTDVGNLDDLLVKAQEDLQANIVSVGGKALRGFAEELQGFAFTVPEELANTLEKAKSKFANMPEVVEEPSGLFSDFYASIINNANASIEKELRRAQRDVDLNIGQQVIAYLNSILQYVNDNFVPAISAGLDAASQTFDFADFVQGIKDNMRTPLVQAAQKELAEALVKNAFVDAATLKNLQTSYSEGKLTLNEYIAAYNEAMSAMSSSIDEGVFDQYIEQLKALGFTIEQGATNIGLVESALKEARDVYISTLQRELSALQAQRQAIEGEIASLEAQYQTLENTYNSALSTYKAILNDEINIQQELASEAQNVVNTFSSFIDKLKETRLTIGRTDIGGLTTPGTYEATRTQLSSTVQKLYSGDTEVVKSALSDLPGLTTEYLETSRAANTDIDAYMRDVAMVQNYLAVAESISTAQKKKASETLRIAQQQMQSLNAQLSLLEETLPSLKEAQAAYNEASIALETTSLETQIAQYEHDLERIDIQIEQYEEEISRLEDINTSIVTLQEAFVNYSKALETAIAAGLAKAAAEARAAAASTFASALAKHDAANSAPSQVKTSSFAGGGTVSGSSSGYFMPTTFHGVEHITPDSQMKGVKDELALIKEIMLMLLDGNSNQTTIARKIWRILNESQNDIRPLVITEAS